MIPIGRCSNCGKAVPVAESILFQGKSFCSEECKKNFSTLQG